jgi:hypothetical protein
MYRRMYVCMYVCTYVRKYVPIDACMCVCVCQYHRLCIFEWQDSWCVMNCEGCGRKTPWHNVGWCPRIFLHLATKSRSVSVRILDVGVCQDLNQASRKWELNICILFLKFRIRLDVNWRTILKLIFKSELASSCSGWLLMAGCFKDSSVVISYTFHPSTARAFSKQERVVTLAACYCAVKLRQHDAAAGHSQMRYLLSLVQICLRISDI